MLDPEVVAQLLVARRADPLAALTPREREVLALMAEGRSNAAIAERLVVTGGAVEKHVSNIFAKINLPDVGADNRRVLAVLAWLRATLTQAEPSRSDAGCRDTPHAAVGNQRRFEGSLLSAWRRSGSSWRSATGSSRSAIPDRVYFSARGETKLDLAQYYLSVADGIVNALYHRPCMLHRFPTGWTGRRCTRSGCRTERRHGSRRSGCTSRASTGTPTSSASPIRPT